MLTEVMSESNTKLSLVYERLVLSTSPNYLFHPRCMGTFTSEFEKQQLASIRLSPEFLSLLQYSAKAFRKTFDSLEILYNKEEKLKSRNKNRSEDYYQFMFEQLFNQQEKFELMNMINGEFQSGKNNIVRNFAEKSKGKTGGKCKAKSSHKNHNEQDFFDSQCHTEEKHPIVDFIFTIFFDDDLEDQAKTMSTNNGSNKKQTKNQVSLQKMFEMII